MLSWHKGFSVFILSFSLASCAGPVMKNLSKQLPPLENDAEVVVYDRGDTVPEHSEILGGIAFIRNTDWETLLETAKKEARAAGGNGIEIQLQVNGYPRQDRRKAHLLSAFILNVNDSIEPSQPTPFEKNVFQDYVVMKEGDTIPCSIVFESKSHLQFVHGYERHGNRKAMSLPKTDLVSYHLEDPEALNKKQKERRLCDDQVGVDCGYSFPSNFSVSANARFVQDNDYSTIGIHYDYSTTFNSHILAGSFGIIGAKAKRRTANQLLDVYLDGGIESPKINPRHRFYFDFLVGLFFGEIEHSYWNNSYSEHIHAKTKSGVGVGLDGGYDYMLSEHLGIGIALYEFFGIPILGTVNGEVEVCNSKYYPLGTIELNAGLRYYF